VLVALVVACHPAELQVALQEVERPGNSINDALKA
jgi:hypothetical protein